jgi:CheY-like chemotaxis protein
MSDVILVVDDDDSLRMILTLQLKRLGFPSKSAENGLQAIDRFNEMDFDLILMDVQMPHLDGLEATVKIRQLEVERNRARTPIIAVTANLDRERCLSSGMDDYMFKPVLLNDLSTMLGRWLKSKT